MNHLTKYYSIVTIIASLACNASFNLKAESVAKETETLKSKGNNILKIERISKKKFGIFGKDVTHIHFEPNKWSLAKAHMAALPIVVIPLRDAIDNRRDIGWEQARQILRDWNEARDIQSK